MKSTRQTYTSHPTRWSWAFTWWLSEEPGSVKTLPIEELKDYISEYTRQMNYITSFGWSKKGRHWKSQDEKYKFTKLSDAFRFIKFRTEILGRL